MAGMVALISPERWLSLAGTGAQFGPVYSYYKGVRHLETLYEIK